MKLYAPDTYQAFRCIAGECRHSCCIGWEIDIDPESLRRFLALPGALGDRMRANIQQVGDTACFRLQGAEERCPFLNQAGLCELILERGESALCQICADHPRFRHFYADRTEIGLGLCCEAAGRLLLGAKAPMRLIIIEDDGITEETDPEETELLNLRDGLLAAMQNRALSMEERVTQVLAPDAVDWREWSAFLLTLERLDERWAELLAALPYAPEAPLSAALEMPMEQLMSYLICRHLPGALEDGDTQGRMLFAALMWRLIARLCALTECGELEGIVELARLYSSEIEYSDENTCAILDHIAETISTKD